MRECLFLLQRVLGKAEVWYGAERLVQHNRAMRRIIRRGKIVLISVTRRVYLYGQRVSFHKLLRSRLIGAGRVPGMGTPRFRIENH